MKNFNVLLSLLITTFASISLSAQFNGSTSGLLETSGRVGIIAPASTSNLSLGAPSTANLTIVENDDLKHAIYLRSADRTDNQSLNIFFHHSPDKKANIQQSAATGELEFFVSNANGTVKKALAINNQQKVSIGNNIATPGDYRLYVARGILTEKVKVALQNTSDWADYVFADDYQLNSIETVEEFVKENKHLPNIPSAEAVVENGINVAEMDAKLLRQIEELWLHTIEINKEKEAMQAKYENLQNDFSALYKRVAELEQK